MAGKIQKQDVKTEAELTGAGASAADLINDTQIYVSQGGTNKTLDDAITDGDVVRPDVVTNAKLSNMATQTIKGRTTAGTGDPEDLSSTQATAILNNMVGDSGSGGTKGLVPPPAAGDAAAARFLKADGSWAVPAGGSATTLQSQTFTASGNWVVPTGVTEVLIRMASGGGGGGGGRAINGGGGAGGAGCFPVAFNQTVVPGDTLTVTVGAGGTAGAATGGTGGTGGTTSVTGSGVSLSLLGGPGGAGGQVTPPSDGTFTSAGGSRSLGGAFFQSGGSASATRFTFMGSSYSFAATSGEASLTGTGGSIGNGSNDSGGGGAGIGNGGNGVANAAGGAGGISAGGAGGSGNTVGGAGGAGRVFIYWVA